MFRPAGCGSTLFEKNVSRFSQRETNQHGDRERWHFNAPPQQGWNSRPPRPSRRAFLAPSRSWCLVDPERGTGRRRDAEAAARREFKEELGISAPGPLRPLGHVRQRSGKIVHAFAMEGTLDVSTVRSNEIEIERPARRRAIASQSIQSGNDQS